MLFSYFSQMVQVHFVTEQQHSAVVPVCPLQSVKNTPGDEQRRPVRDREHHQKDLTRNEINHSSVRVENLQRYPVVSDVNCFVVQCGFNKNICFRQSTILSSLSLLTLMMIFSDESPGEESDHQR